jgi:hypothetical protein
MILPGYNFDRPFTDASTFFMYRAVDRDVAIQYGPTVRALEMSNSEYAARYGRFGKKNNMKPPPSHLRIFGGYVVVRKMGRPEQYETWIPDHVFEEIYSREGAEGRI